jgi:type II secretion system protein G
MVNIESFVTALGMFQVDCGRFPTKEEGLGALMKVPPAIDAARWRGPYLLKDQVLKDPWGHAYVYNCPGLVNTKGYEVYSLGPNGKGGNEAIYWFPPGHQPFDTVNLLRIMDALRMFQTDYGRYPTSAEGLKALIACPSGIPEDGWRGPYIYKAFLMDEWGHPHLYSCPGLHNTNGFDVYSLGPNGKGGNEAIGNWPPPVGR